MTSCQCGSGARPRRSAPLLRGLQRPPPVGEFHGGVQVVGEVGVLLVGGVDAGAEDVLFARGVVVDEGGHVVGGFEDDAPVAFEGGFVFVRAVDELGEVDGMRLLPDQHVGRRRRGSRCRWGRSSWTT
jgi:hypothetical protein